MSVERVAFGRSLLQSLVIGLEWHRLFLRAPTCWSAISVDRASVCGRAGCSINESLLVLGRVVHALAAPRAHRAHVPYRDSKLTRLLQGLCALRKRVTTWMRKCASSSCDAPVDCC